jgi:purine-cytosine permease-like protein
MLDSPLFTRRIPIGIASLLACCFGMVGVVVGMSQVWYTGPIGKMAGGTHGADLGFEIRHHFLISPSQTGPYH